MKPSLKQILLTSLVTSFTVLAFQNCSGWTGMAGNGNGYGGLTNGEPVGEIPGPGPSPGPGPAPAPPAPGNSPAPAPSPDPGSTGQVDIAYYDYTLPMCGDGTNRGEIFQVDGVFYLQKFDCDRLTNWIAVPVQVSADGASLVYNGRTFQRYAP